MGKTDTKVQWDDETASIGWDLRGTPKPILSLLGMCRPNGEECEPSEISKCLSSLALATINNLDPRHHR